MTHEVEMPVSVRSGDNRPQGIPPRTGRPAVGPGQLVLAARMAGVAALVPLLMRTLPLPRVMALLDPGLAPRRGEEAVLATYLRVAEGLFRDARRRLGSNCMRRSLVLFRFLRRAGFPAVIVFGVKRDGGGALDGHAWIELDDTPILEPGDPRTEFSVAFLYPDTSSGNAGSHS